MSRPAQPYPHRCVRGHLLQSKTDRYASNGGCRQCNKDHVAKHRQTAAYRESYTAYYERNREHILDTCATYRASTAGHLTRLRHETGEAYKRRDQDAT